MTSTHEIDATDPLRLFDAWMAQAQETEPNDPNAAALATAALDARPSVRMVLVKRVRERRFCFFTNVESKKGVQLAENPRAALCFHWKSLRRQIRIEGQVRELETTDVDAYFHSRSRASQISAAVSDQSRVVASREELEKRVRLFTEAHPGEVRRPDDWRGFYVVEEQIEFWIDGANRLHDRFLFTRSEDGWSTRRLYP